MGEGKATFKVWKSVTSSCHWLNRTQHDCQRPYNLKIGCVIWATLVMFRIGAITGMMRTQIILTETDKNENKEKRKRGSEEWVTSIEKARSGFFPWASPADMERWS